MKPGQTWRNAKGQLVTLFTSAYDGQMIARRENTTDRGYRVNADGERRGADPSYDLVEQVSRIYIAGPMTGYPSSNYPAFHRAAADWRRLGHMVISPAELHPKGPLDIKKEWNEYMRVDIAALMTCEMIVLLPGWIKSKGARLEHHNARELDFTIVYPANEIA